MVKRRLTDEEKRTIAEEHREKLRAVLPKAIITKVRVDDETDDDGNAIVLDQSGQVTKVSIDPNMN